ncbi:MAG: stimulus-sensing domain-containing protein [Rhodospirillales bacterium]|nr:stimulus-sensing domain-containing protein [Rhodospirillales bacterium]
MATRAHNRRKRRAVSPITRRILAVNVLALAILVVGLLYPGEYRRNLIAAELTALTTRAEVFAAALGESAIRDTGLSSRHLVPGTAGQMVRRLVEELPPQATATRARVFDTGGKLIADSRLLVGAGGVVQVEELPPPGSDGLMGTVLALCERLAEALAGDSGMSEYRENAVQRAADYDEVGSAFSGEVATAVRHFKNAGMVLSVAVPVQRYKQVLGALMLSRGSSDIDAAILDVRLDILKIFAVALTITVLLSVYLAGTIARPIRLLAAAAERVRGANHRQHTIPDMAGRDDEIGELAGALADMTEALWGRIDAIEAFAADVAHEIKNPLTSLQSAVETAARLKDPEQQRKLMAIIQEDVGRLDRLITGISDASRLDAELSRAETAPVDLHAMLAILVDMQGEGAVSPVAGGGQPRFRLDTADGQKLIVEGVEGRLVQVFTNLMANATSFSPPRGTVTIGAFRDGDLIRVEVDDEGPGVPPGKEEAIFERFYTERPEGEAFGTHSGLGLSISRQIVEAHGGTITAEIRRDEQGDTAGTRFTVSLPAA